MVVPPFIVVEMEDIDRRGVSLKKLASAKRVVSVCLSGALSLGWFSILAFPCGAPSRLAERRLAGLFVLWLVCFLAVLSAILVM